MEFNNNFKKWFKNSKIVDEKGNPLICYHGTPNAGFTEFKSNSHFTSNKDYADIYQNQGASSISYKKTADNPDTYAVYLSIQNPFDTRDKKARDIFLNEYQAYYSPDLTDRGMIDWCEAEELGEWLKENHREYDGLIVDEGGTGGYGDEVKSRGIAYIPFSPNQIKSINNNGSFSKSKNIYEKLNEQLETFIEQTAYHGTNAEFDKFDLSKFQRGDFGYGIYLTRDKGYAGDYGKVGEYEIPEYEELLDNHGSEESQSEYVQECIKNITSDLYHNFGLEIYNQFTDVLYRDYCNTGWWLYKTLWDILGSDKEASKYLDKHGIKGIWDYQGNCIVIFNPNNVRRKQ